MEEEEEVEATTELVKREVRRKKSDDVAALQKVLKIAKEIKVPADVLLKESTVEASLKVIELTENLQKLVLAYVSLEFAEESQKEKATCSEVAASEAPRGNNDSHNISNVIKIQFSTTSASLSTSSDMNDIPLDRVYANLQKSLSPSSYTRHQKSLIMILLFPCILLLKKEYMRCNKGESMLVQDYLLIILYNHQ